MVKVVPAAACYKSEPHPCHTCGKQTPIDLLDGKDDGTGDFNILECETCYGPDWLPAIGKIVREKKAKPS